MNNLVCDECKNPLQYNGHNIDGDKFILVCSCSHCLVEKSFVLGLSEEKLHSKLLRATTLLYFKRQTG